VRTLSTKQQKNMTTITLAAAAAISTLPMNKTVIYFKSVEPIVQQVKQETFLDDTYGPGLNHGEVEQPVGIAQPKLTLPRSSNIST